MRRLTLLFALSVICFVSAFAQKPQTLSEKLASEVAAKLPEWKSVESKPFFEPVFNHGHTPPIEANLSSGNRTVRINVRLDETANDSEAARNMMSPMRSFLMRSIVPPGYTVPNLGKEAMLLSRGNVVEIGVSKANLFVKIDLTFPETEKKSRNVYDQTLAPKEEQEIALKIARVITDAVDGERTISPCSNNFYTIRFPSSPQTPEEKLFAAVSNAKFEIIKEILAQKPNLDFRYETNNSFVSSFGQDQNNILHVAVRQGCLDFVKAIVAAGADVNAANNKGETPLMLAAASRHLEMVRFLISAGADAKARDKAGRNAAYYSLTYHYTPNYLRSLYKEKPDEVENARRAILGELTKAGIDLLETAPNDKDTLLLELLKDYGANKAYAKELLDLGIDVNAEDYEGSTALIIAVSFLSREERNEIVRLLLARGANPNQKNKRNFTALSLAQRDFNLYKNDAYTLKPISELINILKEAGAIE
ncbi:MAG TPA: ankyrin repeat domain-containing protein [Pyrinomonadaceae bacterium]|jgi:ankyrin repeat protein